METHGARNIPFKNYFFYCTSRKLVGAQPPTARDTGGGDKAETLVELPPEAAYDPLQNRQLEHPTT